MQNRKKKNMVLVDNDKLHCTYNLLYTPEIAREKIGNTCKYDGRWNKKECVIKIRSQKKKK